MKKEKRSVQKQYTEFHQGSFFRGTLEFTNPTIIHGKYDGDIIGKEELILSETADVLGNIEAPEVIVFGKLKGHIAASESVELRSGAHVTGNIRTPSFEVEDGVIFDGQCEMKQTPQEQSA